MAVRAGRHFLQIPGPSNVPDRVLRAIEAKLADDTDRSIRAVMVVHNETPTGVTSRIPEVRAATDRADHPALLMVDTISSLGSVDYRHEAWRVIPGV